METEYEKRIIEKMERLLASDLKAYIKRVKTISNVELVEFHFSLFSVRDTIEITYNPQEKKLQRHSLERLDDYLGGLLCRRADIHIIPERSNYLLYYLEKETIRYIEKNKSELAMKGIYV